MTFLLTAHENLNKTQKSLTQPLSIMLTLLNFSQRRRRIGKNREEQKNNLESLVFSKEQWIYF